MKKFQVTILAATALFALAIWTVAAQTDDYTKGKQLFESKCQLCHGIDGKGDGPAASALDPTPTNFTKPDFWKGEVDKKITDTVRKGHSPMPAFDLTNDEIKQIIDYMRHAFGNS